MTTLAKDKQRAFETEDLYNDIPVAASTYIFAGCAVGDNASGYARKLVAGDDFRGFADRAADNSAGAAGDVLVHVRREGCVQLAISGLAITDVDKGVYASDDDTFTLTATSNSFIGRVARFVSSGIGIVEFDVGRGSLGEFVALVDSTTGTANGTLNDVTATPAQAIINKNFAELVTRINALTAMLK
jgi:hypothetical protein